jgi:hypothetical protein
MPLFCNVSLNSYVGPKMNLAECATLLLGNYNRFYIVKENYVHDCCVAR